MWRKGSPFALLVGRQIGAVTVESSVEIPQRIKNGSAFQPSNPTSGNILKETQNTNSKEHKHWYVHHSIIYNHQDMEATQVSISRWMDNTTMAHLHNGILLSYKKEENFTLWDSMNGLGEYYDNWNKPEEDKRENKQMGLHETKKFLHSKGNHQQNKNTTH